MPPFLKNIFLKIPSQSTTHEYQYEIHDDGVWVAEVVMASVVEGVIASIAAEAEVVTVSVVVTIFACNKVEGVVAYDDDDE